MLWDDNMKNETQRIRLKLLLYTLLYDSIIQMHLQIPDFTTSFLAMVLFISQNLTESSKVIVGSIKIKVSFFFRQWLENRERLRKYQA